MQLNIGPLVLRHFSGDNWSSTELAFATNPKGGMARRETAVRVGFKSDHLIAGLGRDNPNDRYVTPDGNIVFGKISFTPGGGVHVLSAAQVYAASLQRQAIKAATEEAANLQPIEPVTVEVAEPPAPEPAKAPAKPKATRRTAAARR